MPILGTQINVPAASGSADPRMIGLNISPIPAAAGVTASARLASQPYRANADGSNPVVLGNAKSVNVPDVYKAATPSNGQADPAAATLALAVASAIAAFMASGTAYPAAAGQVSNPKAFAATLAVVQTAIQSYVTAASL